MGRRDRRRATDTRLAAEELDRRDLPAARAGHPEVAPNVEPAIGAGPSTAPKMDSEPEIEQQPAEDHKRPAEVKVDPAPDFEPDVQPGAEIDPTPVVDREPAEDLEPQQRDVRPEPEFTPESGIGPALDVDDDVELVVEDLPEVEPTAGRDTAVEPEPELEPVADVEPAPADEEAAVAHLRDAIRASAEQDAYRRGMEAEQEQAAELAREAAELEEQRTRMN